jgi:hypothetical protein
MKPEQAWILVAPAPTSLPSSRLGVFAVHYSHSEGAKAQRGQGRRKGEGELNASPENFPDGFSAANVLSV